MMLSNLCYCKYVVLFLFQFYMIDEKVCFYAIMKVYFCDVLLTLDVSISY